MKSSTLAGLVVAATVLALPASVQGIDSQLFNSTSNQSLYVYYDTDSVEVGSPVNVYVLGSVSGDTYHFGGDYNRYWEGGSGDYSFDANGLWGYGMDGEPSIDRWMTITPTAEGTFRVGLMFASYPGIEQAHAYIDFTAYDPSAVITSSTSASRNQGQDAAYSITATNSPTSFGATSLPAGASVNTGTGYISGRLTGSGTVNSTISASNSSGGDTVGLTWTITAYSITNTSYLSASVIASGQSLNIIRAGTTNFTFGTTECVVFPPTGSPLVQSNGSYGTYSFTPSSGNGTYYVQVRVADVYGNYVDRTVSFFVGPTAPTGVTATTVGSTFVDLSWTASTGGTIAGYEVYRNGTKVSGSSLVSGTTFTDTSISPSTAYSYTVKAFDTSGNPSLLSTALTGTSAVSFELFTPLP